MAATISVKQRTGTSGSPTNTTITNLRLNTSDTANAGTATPLVKPASGTNRSYMASLYLNADTTPTGTINNVKWYTDGSLGWTGATLYAGTTATYTQATGTSGTTGDDSGVATTDASTLTSAAPLSVSGSLSNPSTGKISDFVVIQMDLSTSVVAGTLTTETATWRYDET